LTELVGRHMIVETVEMKCLEMWKRLC